MTTVRGAETGEETDAVPVTVALPLPLLALLFLIAALPAAALAARGGFDGLYGQDPFAYYGYAVGPLRRDLARFAPPPPFYWPPGYPLLVAATSLLVGTRPLAGQVVSLVAGGLVPVFTALLAREVVAALPAGAGRAGRVGPVGVPTLAGLLMACCGQLWQSSIVVMADTVGLACGTAGVWALARYGRRGGAGWLALAAGALAWAVLARWAYALVALPCALDAALTLLRRARGAPRVALAHAAAALVVAGAIVGPLLLATLGGPRADPAGLAPFGTDLQVYRWHPANALRREFVTADGLLSYARPNGLYYAGAPLLPIFFTPLLGWLIGPGLWGLLRPPRALPLILVAGWAGVILAFHAGAAWQNIRFVLAYAPPCAILIALGAATVARRLGRVGAGVLMAVLLVGIVWMIIGGVGLTRGFIARKATDLAIVRAAAVPPDARLLTFGPTLAFRHYTEGETHDLSELATADLAGFLADDRPTFLLLDLANIEGQWRGRAPELNYRWLRDGPGLTPLGRHGPYTLYRVGAAGGR